MTPVSKSDDDKGADARGTEAQGAPETPSPAAVARGEAATDADIDVFLDRHQVDDAGMRQLVFATRQAAKLIDVRLAQAGLDAHDRANFWQLFTLLR